MGRWLVAIRKYVDFKGRARRREYWTFLLCTTMLALAAVILDWLLSPWNVNPRAGLFYSLFGLAVLLPGGAVTVRRLHDTGRSGWWIFTGLLPLVGPLWLFILTVTDSQTDANRYGTSPKPAG